MHCATQGVMGSILGNSTAWASFSHICASVTKQYNQVPVAEQLRWLLAWVTTLCYKKSNHPTTNYNINNICPIPVIFGTNITE